MWMDKYDENYPIDRTESKPVNRKSAGRNQFMRGIEVEITPGRTMQE
jgi:hypothetical protein